MTPGSRRLRTLLAVLLADAGAVVSLDRLVELLWAGHPPGDPRNTVQTYVSRLREALGNEAPLVTRSPGYVLDVTPEQVDALRFEQLLASARDRRDDPHEARRLLDEALSLWRGPAYAEFADDVAHGEALRLDELRLVAVEEQAAARLALGEGAALAGDLRAELAAHPLRERLVELSMAALATAEQVSEALAVYRSHRQLLADETGLEVSPALRDLEARILAGDLSRSGPTGRLAVGGRDDASADPAIPVVATSLVGRDRELADVRAALRRDRIVTLAGTGGIGKTRLAVEVASAEHRAGRGGVGWVELAPVADPDTVDRAVASALGVDLAGGAPREVLLAALAGRRMLLVLDNAEHLVEAVASLVDDIRRGCPQVRVLTTSRERLAVEGERVVAVAPLDLAVARDGAMSPSVQLFLDRAATAAGPTGLQEQLPVVAEICRELEGLPLAIELAAARVRAVAPDDLLAALRDGVTATLGHRRGRPERHRDLWAVVDWSYRLLDEEERRLFERLSVFAGTFSAPVAHEVCAPDAWGRAETIERLGALAERSLVVGPGAAHRDGGYRLLRPLRTFARQRLADRGEADELAARHAAVHVEAVERAAGPPLTDAGRRWLEAALDDLRGVARRARLTRDGRLLGRLVAATYRFDYWRPGGELHGWAYDALALEGTERTPTAPQVHAAAAVLAWKRGDLADARRLAEAGTRLGAGADDPARAVAFDALGDVANFEGRLDEAEDAFREEERLARLADDPDGRVLGLASAALVLAYGGRVEESLAEVEAAARLAAAAGPAARAFVRYVHGECLAETEPGRAIDLVDEAAELADACGAWFVAGVARVTAASVRARHDQPSRALPAFAEVLRHWRRSGSWTQQWTTLRNLAELLVRLGADEPAVTVATAVESQHSATPVFGAGSDRLERSMARARHRLGEEAFATARARGASLPPHEAVAFALTAIREAAPQGAPA